MTISKMYGTAVNRFKKSSPPILTSFPQKDEKSP